jgi:hypothetical protein
MGYQKKAFYSGLKSEFFRPKTFLKTLFMHLKPRLNSLEKKTVCIFYPGYQIRGLPVCFLIVYEICFKI